EDLIAMKAAERDLGSGDQAKVAVLDAINLRLGAARDEADSFEHFLACQVRSDNGRIAFRHELFHGELDESHLAESRLVFQEGKLLAGDAGARFEVDEI